MAERFDEGGGKFVRNTGQVPVSLPTAGRTVASQEEHVTHLQISTFAEAHCNRKRACLPGITQRRPNAHDLRWRACRYAPRLLFIQPKQDEPQRHNAEQRNSYRLPVDVLAPKFAVALFVVIDVAAAEAGVRGHQCADLPPHAGGLATVPCTPQKGVWVCSTFFAPPG